MSHKSKNKKYDDQNKTAKVPVVNEPAVAYQSKVGVELFDKEGSRQYYTVEEYAENLRTAINQHYGCELIAKQ